MNLDALFEYFKGFDYKKLLFRTFTLAYTAFLAGFTKDYQLHANIAQAVQEGLNMISQGLIAGFSLDQLMFHFSKSK
jgi:hypothetical protein